MFRLRLCLATIPTLLMMISPTASQEGGDEFKEGLDRWRIFPSQPTLYNDDDISAPGPGSHQPEEKFGQNLNFNILSRNFSLYEAIHLI